MIKIVRGIVRGKTIELSENPGVADGQKVEITIKSIPLPNSWGEGLQRAAGSLSREWTEEDDRILAEIHRDRSRDERNEISE